MDNPKRENSRRRFLQMAAAAAPAARPATVSAPKNTDFFMITSSCFLSRHVTRAVSASLAGRHTLVRKPRSPTAQVWADFRRNVKPSM